MRAILLALTLASPAIAEPLPCGPRETAIASLAAKYGERQIGMGLLPKGAAVAELLVNPDTGTWTILLTDAGQDARPAGLGNRLAGSGTWAAATERVISHPQV